MNLRFGESEEQLRAAVQSWFRKSYSMERRCQIVQAGGFDRNAYRDLAALGVCGLYARESVGGSALQPADAMVVLEELGRGLALEPIAHVLVCSMLLESYGMASQASTWLPAVCSGDALLVLAWQEHSSDSRFDTCETRARCVDGSWEITGFKASVPAGDRADGFLLPARNSDEISLFLVDARSPRITRKGYQLQDGSRAADLNLSRTPAIMIAARGAPAVKSGIDFAIAMACASGIGVMDEILALTVAYVKARKQFGVPLANFQVLRHYIADMKIQLELARSMSYYATLKLHSSPAERRYAVAQAKYQLGTSMRFVGQHAIQLHGGVGLTDEYTLSHLFKSLTQLEMSFGHTFHHLHQLSDLVAETAQCECLSGESRESTKAE